MVSSGSKGRPVHEARRLRGQSVEKSRQSARSPEPALRRALVAAARQMNRLGLNQGAAGNLSARFGDGMLITPSGVSYEALAPEMIVRMSLEAQERGAQGELRASSEWRLHRDLLRARPDADAVVHAHPIHATALSMLREPVPPVHYMVALFGGADVRCAAYAPFGSQELSDGAVAAMEGRTAALLANHGAVVIGPTLEAALDRLLELETLARMYAAACAFGRPVRLTRSEIDEALLLFADYRAARRDEA